MTTDIAIKRAQGVALALLLLSGSGVSFLVYWQVKLTNQQLRSAINEAQWAIAEARPELRTILNESKLGTRELRVAAKAFTEDFNSRENMRGRMATYRAGESVAALAARIEADTLPLVNQSLRRSDEAINAAAGLLRNTDTSLNSQLLPEATKLLASLKATSDAFNVDGRALFAEVLALVKSGETSMEAVNKVLSSPEWMSILASIDGSAKNIEATTASMPGVARSVERIAQTSAKFSRAILVAQLLSTIARALIP